MPTVEFDEAGDNTQTAECRWPIWYCLTRLRLITDNCCANCYLLPHRSHECCRINIPIGHRFWKLSCLSGRATLVRRIILLLLRNALKYQRYTSFVFLIIRASGAFKTKKQKFWKCLVSTIFFFLNILNSISYKTYQLRQ